MKKKSNDDNSKTKKETRTTIILDTSVLLYDKQSIHSLPNADIVLPLVVLDELDTFKDRSGLLGESARYINRFLDKLRSDGRLDKGVSLKDTNQSIRVICTSPDSITGLDGRSDNKIIATALDLIKENKKLTAKNVKIITKDINLRVKCDALGLIAEDYLKDHVSENFDEYGTVKTLQLSDNCIDTIYSEGFVENNLNLLPEDIRINSYCIVKGESKSSSVLCQYKGDRIIQVNDFSRKSKYSGIKPRNTEQSFVCHALHDELTPVVCLTGLAGSGKTFLSIMSALDALEDGKYDRIVFTRSMEPVGKEIGFLPGDIHEKMSPWLSPLLDNVRTHFKDKEYFEMLIEKGKVEIAPLSFIRGRTFNNCFLIVDEAQNATIHELKTIITRIGENSKIVLMGDTDQIDTPYIDKRSNGLSIVIERFRDCDLMSHIHLVKGERSKLATTASKLL